MSDSEHLIILRQDSVKRLRDSIADNISLYESDKPDWAGFFGGEMFARETSVEICGCPLAECIKPGDLKDDVNRSIAIYRALANLTPQQAADERVWTYLTHFIFWDYTRARWPLPKNKNKKAASIRAHFFAGDIRRTIRDNAISRLWWMAHVSSRSDVFLPEKALSALLYREDVRKEVMERATFFRSERIYNSLMGFMLRSYEGQKKLLARESFRQLSKSLNRVGGKQILDSLEPPDLDALIARLIAELPGDELNLDPKNL